jgi:hypothetical protein
MAKPKHLTVTERKIAWVEREGMDQALMWMRTPAIMGPQSVQMAAAVLISTYHRMKQMEVRGA